MTGDDEAECVGDEDDDERRERVGCGGKDRGDWAAERAESCAAKGGITQWPGMLKIVDEDNADGEVDKTSEELCAAAMASDSARFGRGRASCTDAVIREGRDGCCASAITEPLADGSGDEVDNNIMLFDATVAGEGVRGRPPRTASAGGDGSGNGEDDNSKRVLS